MQQAPASSANEIPRLIAKLREHIQRKTGKPIDPDVDFITTQIEVLSASGPMQMVGMEYGLAMKECQLLTHLARRPGMIFTREAIMNALYYDRAEQPAPKLLDVMVYNIRAKLRTHNAPCWIEAVWGTGLRYVNTPARKGKKFATQGRYE